MQRQTKKRAARYLRQRRRQQRRNHIMSIAAVVVAVCTFCLLILPAITMETETVCGLEEHLHNDSCYTKLTPQPLLSCSYESLGVHTHGEGCRNAEGKVICGYCD